MEYIKIKIPIEVEGMSTPKLKKEIKVTKEKHDKTEEDAIHAEYPPGPNTVIRQEWAKFVWNSASPGCVTFTILGIDFQVCT